MKLLHITATHLNPSGGVPVVLKNLVNEQNNIIGFSARVLSLKATVERMESKYFDFLGNQCFKTYIREFNPDIVIIHSFFYFSYISVGRILNKLGIQYVIEPHGSFGRAALNQKSKLIKKIANFTLFQRLIKNSKAFIFLNEMEQANSVFRTPFDIIIPNGINPNLINFTEIPKTQYTKHIYYIGRFDIIHKGLDYLLEALCILDKGNEKIDICLFGDGDIETKKIIQNKISHFNSIRVINMGPLYGSDQQIVLEQFGPMILTSRYEGFPMTILEALAYGNPCIVTPGTNVSDEIREQGLGWAVELNSQKIAEGIRDACNDYSVHRIRYIKRCKEYVRDNYSWKLIAGNSYHSLLDLIEKLYKAK